MKRNSKFVLIQKDTIQQIIDGKKVGIRFLIPFDILKNRTEVVALIEQFRKEGAESSVEPETKNPWDHVVNQLAGLTTEEG